MGGTASFSRMRLLRPTLLRRGHVFHAPAVPQGCFSRSPGVPTSSGATIRPAASPPALLCRRHVRGALAGGHRRLGPELRGALALPPRHPPPAWAFPAYPASHLQRAGLRAPRTVRDGLGRASPRRVRRARRRARSLGAAATTCCRSKRISRSCALTSR